MTERDDGGTHPSPEELQFQDELSKSASSSELLKAFENDYVALLRRLSGGLGSREAAVDALHDTYIKLRSGPDIGQVRAPHSYLYKMALNLARNRQRKEARILPFANSDFLDLPDAAPSQDRVVEAAQEIMLAITGLRSISIKRQQIFLAKWRDDKSQAEIASEFGLHKRSVQKELAKAEASVRAALQSSMVI